MSSSAANSGGDGSSRRRPGTVYLVGAGPGDPQLITVGGKGALERADVVVYDRLAHPRLLEYAPASAERIFAGKMADRHTMTQDEINAALAGHALAGKTVARLKGGDPFVFGRGGEEAEYLRQRGIPFVIIPGISSAIAAPAYAGIPVTHRDDSSSFAVITGHEREDARESGTRAPGEAEGRRRWDRIAYAADTLVFLMGVESIGEIAHRLMENGRSAATPVAMVRWGTWLGRQETLTATLGDIAARVTATGFKAPAVTVVGEVARWRERLRWWDNRPLSGRAVVVTRAREQASAMTRQLEELGAEVIEFPTIKTHPPADGYAALDAAIAQIAYFHWIVLASATAVDALFQRLRAARVDSRALHQARIAAVGPATAERLFAYGITADFTPQSYTGEDVARELPLDDSSGHALRVLIPRAARGGDALPEILRERGATVDVAAAYETSRDEAGANDLRQRLAEGSVDALTFTASSTVKNFVEALGDAVTLAPGVVIACIGPSTAQAAREAFGREPDVTAERHTVEGLVEALAEHYAAR